MNPGGILRPLGLSLALAVLAAPASRGQDAPPQAKKAETPTKKAQAKKAQTKTPLPPVASIANEPSQRAETGFWMDRHKLFLDRVKPGDAGLLFIGDSITQGWEGAGKDVWRRFYAERKAVNLGIGGDRTQHVLWRLDHGEIDGIKPKAAVVMIGTNNMGANTPEEIADGVKRIVERLRKKLPETRILLLAIFPRAEKPDNPIREKVKATNDLIAKLADGKHVHSLDIGKHFLESDGAIAKEIMPDFLHLTPKGYRIWADAIEPTLWRLMND